MKKFKSNLIFLTILVIFGSCLNRQFVEGRAEIVASSAMSLNDSSLIMGHVYHVDASGKERYFINEFEITVDNSDLTTSNDTTGYYLIKTVPETYTIKCQSKGNQYSELLVVAKDIELSKNTKTEINFYVGYTIE